MGPLNGYTVIELGGIGPAPMAGMMLADMGAEVIRIDRAGAPDPRATRDISFRGKKSVVLNLKSAQGRETLLRMVENADVLIEPYRPGVAEKLGVGPDVCLQRNPRLVYGRMTGWGQDGPLASAAGHDINYISITGALHAIGRADEPPVPPLNLVGDFGGGGMLLVQGILAALLECQSSGQGQVVDAAMVDGTAQLMWMMHSWHAAGAWNAGQREANMLDGGAHYYGVYETADGKYISIGSIEPQFYALLKQLAGLDEAAFGDQNTQAKWPEQKRRIAAIFRQKTRDEWCALMEGSDVCFAPVLTMTEAPQHPHNAARGTYFELDGVVQPAPAPRLSRTPASVRHGARAPGADTTAVLAAMGFGTDEIEAMRAAGVLG